MKLKEILARSLELLHVVDADSDIEPELLKRAARFLELMLDAWSIERLTIPVSLVTHVEITELRPKYNVETDLGLTSEPLFFTHVSYGHGESSHELKSANDGDYQRFIRDEIISQPSQYLYRKESDGNYIYFNCIPCSDFNLTLITQHDFAENIDFDDYHAELSLDKGYAKAIVYNLALELAPTYSKEAPATVYRMAKSAKRKIKSYNSKPIARKYRHSKGQRNKYNTYGGWQ